jgi:hypothetical protein
MHIFAVFLFILVILVILDGTMIGPEALRSNLGTHGTQEGSIHV